ncbi:MAG: NUDIX domain-containing protein [Candidatus Poribacteria bacterium]|nr:NUDIX domain-containing protein [Candidatus Poribacteria bacterium]
MRHATLCFPIRVNTASGTVSEILLAEKKSGFGKGKIVGIGGFESGETSLQAVVRETREECHLSVFVVDLQPMAKLIFDFPYRPGWNHLVEAFLTEVWTGNLTETAEVKPIWLAVSKIPYHKMWADARHWLPLVLERQQITASFTYNSDNQTLASIDIEVLGLRSYRI